MADKNFIVKNGLEVGGQEVVSSSGVVTSAALGGQTLASTDSPTFNNLTLTNDIAVGGDLNLTGDLNITGDVNSLSVTDLDVTDQTITLGAGQVESASGGSGIVVDGSGASILWDETNDQFDINKGLNVTGEAEFANKLKVYAENNAVVAIDSLSNAYMVIDRSADNRRGALVFSTAAADVFSAPPATGTINWALGVSDSDELSGNKFAIKAGDTNFSNAQFVIDTSGNVGIGTDSPAAKLHIESAATNEAIRFNTATGYNAGINYYVNNTIKWTAQVLGDGTDAYRFYNFASGEAMRIDSSGNVGIGTDSPTDKLEIGTTTTGGSMRVVSSSYANNGLLRFFGTDNVERLQMGALSGTAAYIYTPASTDLVTYTGGTEKMRITSAGIVDIGKVSFSSYPTGAKLNVYGDGEGFRLDGTGATSRSIRFRNVGTNGISNAIIVSDGSLQLKNEDANAAMYFNSVRDMEFQVTSGNGTAGNMTFLSYNTEIMRIDGANNRVGIGQSDPATTLHIGDGASHYVRIENAASGDVASGYQIYRGASTVGMSLYDNPADDMTTLQVAGGFNINANSSGLDFQVSELGLVRVVAGSNGTGLCINNTDVRISLNQSNYGKYKIAAAHVSGGTAHLGRKSADGYTTNALIAEYWGVESAWAKGALAYKRISSYDQGEFQWWLNATAAGTEVSSSDTKMRLERTGALHINGSLTQNASDERMKENITLIPNALEKVKQLRGVSFTWKDIENSPHEAGTEDIGVIAQDVEAVLPLIVKPAPFDTYTNTTDEGDEETKETTEVVSRSGENYKTVEYEKLVPLLIESIKELEARIKTLEG